MTAKLSPPQVPKARRMPAAVGEPELAQLALKPAHASSTRSFITRLAGRRVIAFPRLGPIELPPTAREVSRFEGPPTLSTLTLSLHGRPCRSLERKMPTRAMLDDLLQDIRYAVRRLRRDASFAAFAILIAGLGIGASVTVFSIS